MAIADMQTEPSTPERFLHYSRIAFRRIQGLPVSDTADDATDLRDLFPLAHKHRMVGIFYAGTTRKTTTELQRSALAQAQQSARYTYAAIQIKNKLQQAISPAPILIKGPGLAIQAWPDPALRAFDDFDFRCRREDFASFKKVALAAGYLPFHTNAEEAEHLWHYGWGVTFRHADGFYLEVNHRLFPTHFPCPASLAPPDHVSPVSEQLLDGERILLPTPAAHLVLASAHALWHGGERLAWIADIAGLLVRHPDIMQPAQQLCGNHTFLRRSLLTACLLADQLFGPELAGWETIKDNMRPQINPHMLDACKTYRSQLTAPHPPCHATRRRLQRPLCSIREKLRACLLQALIPGDPDFSSLCLKPEQRNRYWLHRPLRILRERIRANQ